MKKLYVEVEKTVDGITGNVLDMELSEKNGENVDDLSGLFVNAEFSQPDYDRLTDIWNKYEMMIDILKALKEADLIIDFEIKDEKED